MTADTTPKIAKRLVLTVGKLPKPGTLPDPYPNETLEPNQQGFSARGGVPCLSQHFRVLVIDLRGNGRFDRPTAQADYSFDHYYADFVAVLDTLKVDRTAVVGISATTMTAIRLAHEQRRRVSHLISAGGWVNMRMEDPAMRELAEQAPMAMHNNWPAFLNSFFGAAFSEPHSTKPLDDAVLRNGWVSNGETVAMGRTGWLGNDVRKNVIPSANAWEASVGTLRAKPMNTTCRLFFALRAMDEVMALNFLVFAELMKTEHYDIVVGDEGWEVDTRFGGEPQLGGGVAAAPI